MEVHSSHVTVPGSRWPIIVGKMGLDTLPTGDAQLSSQFPKTLISNPIVILPTASNANRRKPKVTYRSPDADTPLHFAVMPTQSAITPFALKSEQPAATQCSSFAFTSKESSLKSDQTTSHTQQARFSTPMFTPAPTLYRMRPPLPVYHPLNRRGLTSFVASSHERVDQSKEVTVVQDGDTGGKRSSSRARKSVAKVKEAEGQVGMKDDGAGSTLPTDFAFNGILGVYAPAAKNGVSPKRKRAGGGGGVARKKRKEGVGAVSERDMTYPNRKSRSLRANAAAAIASSTDAQANGIMDLEPASPADSNTLVSEAAPAAEEKDADTETKRPTRRARRPRLAAAAPVPTSRLTRRNSSASEATATSVSVSIAGALAASQDSRGPIDAVDLKDSTRPVT